MPAGCRVPGGVVKRTTPPLDDPREWENINDGRIRNKLHLLQCGHPDESDTMRIAPFPHTHTHTHTHTHMCVHTHPHAPLVTSDANTPPAPALRLRVTLLYFDRITGREDREFSLEEHSASPPHHTFANAPPRLIIPRLFCFALPRIDSCAFLRRLASVSSCFCFSLLLLASSLFFLLLLASSSSVAW